MRQVLCGWAGACDGPIGCLFQGLRRRYTCSGEPWTTLCSGFRTRAVQVRDDVASVLPLLGLYLKTTRQACHWMSVGSPSFVAMII